MFVKCQICGRRLSDPVSIRRGMGPSCLARQRMKIRKISKQEAAEGIGIQPPKFHGFVIPEDLEKVNLAKVYTAVREERENMITVSDDKGTRPLKHIVYHSPAGMEWGYEGSGSADLARSILADFAGIKVADTFYQDFKWDFISKQPEKGFTITGEEILNWLKRRIENDNNDNKV